MPEFSEIRGPRGQNSPPDGKRYNLSDGKRYSLSDGKRYNLSDGGGTVCRTGAVQSVGRGRYSLSDGGGTVCRTGTVQSVGWRTVQPVGYGRRILPAPPASSTRMALRRLLVPLQVNGAGENVFSHRHVWEGPKRRPAKKRRQRQAVSKTCSPRLASLTRPPWRGARAVFSSPARG